MYLYKVNKSYKVPLWVILPLSPSTCMSESGQNLLSQPEPTEPQLRAILSHLHEWLTSFFSISHPPFPERPTLLLGSSSQQGQPATTTLLPTLFEGKAASPLFVHLRRLWPPKIKDTPSMGYLHLLPNARKALSLGFGVLFLVSLPNAREENSVRFCSVFPSLMLGR